MSKQLAEILFPDIDQKPKDIIDSYDNRDEDVVTRFAPSPTGFLHLGGVYTALIGERFTHLNDGSFILRIEDTDQERKIKDGVQQIVDGLNNFDIKFDEGPVGPNQKEIGNYGPYIQSNREEIYKIFIKDLIKQGKAYPCFLSKKELDDIRNKQKQRKLPPGIYGEYAKYRDVDIAKIKKNLQDGKDYVIRLYANAKRGDRTKVTDILRGTREIDDNYRDVVILKSGGLPTYHFAHIVDDYLMGTTHVIRGDEWFASLPLHVQMFDIMGWEEPKYAHVAPLMKSENGKKRKLSKRKDPEANIEYFLKEGYPTGAVAEFLLNIANSCFENRRNNNPEKSYKQFDFKLTDMNKSGALVDMEKLEHVSKEYVSRLGIKEFYNKVLQWAEKYNKKLYNYMVKYPEYTKSALNIERQGPQDPKRVAKRTDVPEQLMFFYDEEFDKLFDNGNVFDGKSIYDIVNKDNFSKDDMKKFIKDYFKVLDLNQNKQDWFSHLREFGKDYADRVGHLAMLLRVGITGSKVTPDLYEMMCVMGKDRVKERMYKVLGITV